MLDAVVGSVIMVVATTSLVYAIDLAQRASSLSGYQPLSTSEQEFVNGMPAGFPDAISFESMNSDLFRKK